MTHIIYFICSLAVAVTYFVEMCKFWYKKGGDATDAVEELKPNDLKTKVECDVIKHLTERNIERSKILAVIHAYDETPESKLARIWEVLRREA